MNLTIWKNYNGLTIFDKPLSEIKKIIVSNDILYVELYDGFKQHFLLEKIDNSPENFVTYSCKIS